MTDENIKTPEEIRQETQTLSHKWRNGLPGFRISRGVPHIADNVDALVLQVVALAKDVSDLAASVHDLAMRLGADSAEGHDLPGSGD
jgi:hypothetical protein